MYSISPVYPKTQDLLYVNALIKMCGLLGQQDTRFGEGCPSDRHVLLGAILFPRFQKNMP